MRLGFIRSRSTVSLSDIPTWPTMFRNLKENSKYKVAPLHEKYPNTVNASINEKISIWQGDITILKIGAIVNAANTGLWAGGGICGAIHNAAGPQLERECERLDGCPTGETKITPGFNLPSKYVLHSVGPTDKNPNDLTSCYKTCLQLCLENKIRSIAFCCIATGIFGYPNFEAALIALKTVRKWMEEEEHRNSMDRIIFCTYLDIDYNIYSRLAPVFFPTEEVKKDTDQSQVQQKQEVIQTQQGEQKGTTDGKEEKDEKMSNENQGKDTKNEMSDEEEKHEIQIEKQEIQHQENNNPENNKQVQPQQDNSKVIDVQDVKKVETNIQPETKEESGVQLVKKEEKDVQQEQEIDEQLELKKEEMDEQLKKEGFNEQLKEGINEQLKREGMNEQLKKEGIDEQQELKKEGIDIQQVKKEENDMQRVKKEENDMQQVKKEENEIQQEVKQEQDHKQAIEETTHLSAEGKQDENTQQTTNTSTSTSTSDSVSDHKNTNSPSSSSSSTFNPSTNATI